MNGHMAEAQQGFAVLKEVDEGTFTRFAQWAYSGYYISAKHEINPNANYKGYTPAQKETGSEWVYSHTHESNPFNIFSPTEESEPSNRQSLEESFKYKYQRSVQLNFPLPRENCNATEDYTNVFLCHARVYVFADQYDVQSLKSFALEELHLALANYILYPERTGDIVALLTFIYSHTSESVSGVEDLRSVLTAYMSYEMDTLMKDSRFKELMIEDGGTLLGEFMKAVERRI